MAVPDIVQRDARQPGPEGVPSNHSERPAR
jgi:hypothetical protein